ncbi:hypothetical protein LCGC14_0248520 [marine sediment metagenome]|uniref:Uncharacterized protein n=1 Tax=marine sediment metagenome TaxID=412755 RepID=A0A0F9U505_9ZZZZ
MSEYIFPEYWIQCTECGNDTVMVALVPTTGCISKTKREAWQAAKGSGWGGGSYSKPICPDCKGKENR